MKNRPGNLEEPAAAHTVAIRLELPAAHSCLHIASACLAALLERFDVTPEHETFSYNAQLAVQEACTNIVDHAYAGQQDKRLELRMALTEAPRRLIIDLYDTGASFDESLIDKPDFDEPQEHGYGLFLIHSLMDEVTYAQEEGRNHWQLIKEF